MDPKLKIDVPPHVRVLPKSVDQAEKSNLVIHGFRQQVGCRGVPVLEPTQQATFLNHRENLKHLSNTLER